jgi:SAM-dependent methyltransferase
MPGYINLDKFPGKGVDVVCDLEEGKLPFDDESVDYINADQVFEHIFHWERLMPEMFRVLKPGAIARIAVPYRTSQLNAFHVRFFDTHAMDYFCLNYGQTWSMEAGPMFNKYRIHVSRSRPFGWHLNKYLGIAPDSRLGLRKESIIFELQKPERKADP